MKFVSLTLPTTMAFVASSPGTPIVIGQQAFWLTGMEIGLEVASSGASTTVYQDWFLRGFTSMSLVGDGRTYLQVSSRDIRSLYWATRLRLRGRAKLPDIVTGSVTQSYGLPVVFGVHPLKPNGDINWYDLSAAVKCTPDLTFNCNFGATSAIASATKVLTTSTLIRLTLYGVVFEESDRDPKTGKLPLPQMFPEFISRDSAPTQTYAGLGLTVPMPIGRYIRRTTVMSLVGASGGSDVRLSGYGSNTGTSEIAITTADNRRVTYQKFWDFAHMSQTGFQSPDDNSDVTNGSASLAGGITVTTVPTNQGVGQFDYVTIADTRNPALADPQYGLNMTDKVSGAANHAFTVDVATNADIQFLDEMYSRYPDSALAI